MLSRRIDLTTELSLEEVKRLEDRIADAFLATRKEGYLIPPSRITLKPPVDEARKKAEEIRSRYVIIAFEPERRREAIEAMKCPFIDAISFTLETAYLINKSLMHFARVNNKFIELRLIGDLRGIRGLLKARHRLTVKYVPVYFGSGARSIAERADTYAMNGFLRRILKYDLLSRSARNQRSLYMRNARRLEFIELARGVLSIKNILPESDDRHAEGGEGGSGKDS